MKLRDNVCLTYEEFKRYFETYINIEEKNKDLMFLLDHMQMETHVNICPRCHKIAKEMHDELWNAESVDIFWQKFDEYWNNNVEVLGDDSKPKSR